MSDKNAKGSRSQKSEPDRRSFLKLAGIGAAGAVVLSTTAKPVGAATSQHEGRGYSKTAHVKKVYDLSRF